MRVASRAVPAEQWGRRRWRCGRRRRYRRCGGHRRGRRRGHHAGPGWRRRGRRDCRRADRRRDNCRFSGCRRTTHARLPARGLEPPREVIEASRDAIELGGDRLETGRQRGELSVGVAGLLAAPPLDLSDRLRLPPAEVGGQLERVDVSAELRHVLLRGVVRDTRAARRGEEQAPEGGEDGEGEPWAPLRAMPRDHLDSRCARFATRRYWAFTR